ncbi:hypothetical protein GCM10009850_092670 [Nonomuraea monospora]|uniref:Uncharacterized protein n=1 Tax=Nonomuraea monospora TaxID=568818 RepID=A0ABN3CWE1_9ACTN
MPGMILTRVAVAVHIGDSSVLAGEGVHQVDVVVGMPERGSVRVAATTTCAAYEPGDIPARRRRCVRRRTVQRAELVRPGRGGAGAGDVASGPPRERRSAS